MKKKTSSFLKSENCWCWNWMKCWYGHALKPRPRSEIEQDKLDPKGITFSKLLSKLFIFHTKLIFNCHNFTISTFLWEEPCLKLSNPGFGLKSCVHLFLMLPFKYETPIISIQANISSNHCLQLVVSFCFWVFEHMFFLSSLYPLIHDGSILREMFWPTL